MGSQLIGRLEKARLRVRTPASLLLAATIAVSVSRSCLADEPAAALPAPKSPLFHVPDGFVVDRVTDGLGIQFPMFGAFADDGRLFVAESSGLDLYEELKVGARNSRIRVLEDADGDGQFETALIFADQLVGPMGLAWRDGKLYVADPPDVIVLTDDNEDGRADGRKAILSGFGHQTNGSLHGLVFGPDGMLYMTMGSPDGYSLRRADGTVLTGDSGALIRCRPDGSDPEVLSRGFVNLIEVAFTARGDIIGTDNWFQQPESGMRDALVHLIGGGLYPYLADSGTRYPLTGTVLPSTSLYPAVALSGLVCYQGPMFPREMRGNLFTAQFNARKVVRHKLVPHGSTFGTADQDFMTTDDPEFHPSDVVESADGSLLVIDTGSWYVQHCPTGRIRDVQAPGGIYRIRHLAAPSLKDPWGRKVKMDEMTPEQLARMLDDTRPVVRERAVRALSALGADSVPALAATRAHSQSTAAKQHAIWALASNRNEAAFAPLRDALADGDPNIVAPAIRALMWRDDTQSSTALKHLLNARDPAVRLAAAEALAHVGSPSVLHAIWQALAEERDPFLDHALIYAAHRLADAPALQAALAHPSPTVQKAAMLLLDQPPRAAGALEHQAVLARLDPANDALRQAALEVLARHPEWAIYCVDYLRELLVAPGSKKNDDVLTKLLPVFQANARLQEIIAAAIRGDLSGVSIERRVRMLELVSQSTLADWPRVWIDAIDQAIGDPAPQVRLAAVRCAAVLQIGEFDDRFAHLANSPDQPADVRREALRAIVPRQKELQPQAFDLLINDVSSEADPLLRLAAAEMLGATTLDTAQLSILLRTIDGDTLIAPAVLLPMLERSTTATTAPQVIRYFEEAIRNGWHPPLDSIAGVMRLVSDEERKRLEAAIQSTGGNSAELQAQLAKYLPLIEGGDAEQGREVFRSSKAACFTCHRVGAEGGSIGPDLTKIGAIRADRDLIESIVFPGSTIAQEFELYAVVTSDGRIISGIMREHSADTIVLRDSSGAETRLRRKQIEEMDRQSNSMMPEGLTKLLTREELRNLIAYLQSLR
jgi:putative membrane-bound dehydrogenase-like protein